MYSYSTNPNNFIIGIVLLFLVGSTFFIMRRMYNRHIKSLEAKIQNLHYIIDELQNNSNNTSINEDIDISSQNNDSCNLSNIDELFKNALHGVPIFDIRNRYK